MKTMRILGQLIFLMTSEPATMTSYHPETLWIARFWVGPSLKTIVEI